MQFDPRFDLRSKARFVGRQIPIGKLKVNTSDSAEKTTGIVKEEDDLILVVGRILSPDLPSPFTQKPNFNNFIFIYIHIFFFLCMSIFAVVEFQEFRF